MQLGFCIRGIVGLSLIAATMLAGVEPASAYPCTNVNGRAGNLAANVTVATGVDAVIKTPASGAITGLASGRPSAADVYLGDPNSPGNWVQAGWYLGGVAELPYVTTPRMFWGEGNSAVPTDDLHDTGINLSWNTYYQFTIVKRSSGDQYDIYLQNSYRASTSSRPGIGRPGFNGDVNYLCTRMEARASHANAPQRTLRYRYGSWAYWDSGKFSKDSHFFSINGGDIATNYSYGGGS